MSIRVYKGCPCIIHEKQKPFVVQDRCVAAVTQPPHHLHDFQCGRKWKVELLTLNATLKLCRQHAKGYMR